MWILLQTIFKKDHMLILEVEFAANPSVYIIFLDQGH